MKKILPYLLLAILAMPGLASAGETINPLNGNAWTLYVFGNGDAIFHILQSIKLLMLPDSGDTGFNSLLMFLATLGFLVLAIQAGFDPGKNLMKMFTYILVVGCVHMTTMSITANIRIRDAVTDYDNVVPGVPALVGVPAALISEVGQWFTKTIETYYNIPSEMTVSGGAFNLFGRLMQESNEYVISNPELKKSLSAYVADCVVPAMAQGRMSASDLMTAPKMTDALAKATHNAIMTKYWPMGIPSTTGTGMSYPATIDWDADNYPVQGGLGAVIPCAGAWQHLSQDMTVHADELMAASARQWSKTGVLIPFETAMSSAMAMASNGGANAFGNYSKPQGFILQQAMLNSMNGSFRSAAASIGNNEVMMAASIAQAEQSQKSSWFTAARVFTNMMGYVYTTLQAFIFAIVPIVIIALMVPGLGKSIFTNYSQILVWLTLWQPMLSIVNYLITLFGKAQIASSLELAAGVTMQNKFIMTEQTNDLMLAAQFLGTSVPLLTWGLVKGSLAFTEFISHGIGSSMAQQAGATAATGNMSMNNMSMDNASMNKFNTAMSSAVGAQSTMGYSGGAETSFAQGGTSNTANGGSADKKVSHGISNQQADSLTQAASYSEAAAKQMSDAEGWSKDNKFGQNNSKIAAATSGALDNAMMAYNLTKGAGSSEAREKAASAAVEVANTAQRTLGVNAQLGVTMSSDKQIAGKAFAAATGISADASLKGTAAAASAASILEKSGEAEAYKKAYDLKNGVGTSDGGGRTLSDGRSATNQVGQGRDQTYSHAMQVQMSESFNTAAQKSSQAASTMSTTASNAVMMSQNERYSQVDMSQNDQFAGSGAGSVRGIAAATSGEVAGRRGPALGVNENDMSKTMTDKAKGDIAASAALDADKVLRDNPLHSGAPAAPANPAGVNVRKQVQEGREGAERSIAAEGKPMADANAALAKKNDVRAHTGAFAYGAERGAVNGQELMDGLKSQQKKDEAVQHVPRAGRE